MIGGQFSCRLHNQRRENTKEPKTTHTPPVMALRYFKIRMRSPHSGEVSGTNSAQRRSPPPRRSLRPRRGLSGKFSARAARPLRRWSMRCAAIAEGPERAPVYTPGLSSDNHTVRPHMLQKWAPEGANAPHWLQNRPAFTGTILTGMYLSAEQAQINAINQPMTVQPASRFTRKIPIKSALCLASMVGRK
jgi:hypothetical protein